MARSLYLTKSRYIQGLQCTKLLWLSVSGKDIARPAEVDDAARHRFEIGNKVTEYARLCFPNGILITENHLKLNEAVDNTKTIMSNAKVVFEPTFLHSRFICRLDIIQIVPEEDNLWDLYEIKMSTRVKDIHIPDIAIQRACLEAGGFNIRKTMLIHINTSYTRKGEIEPEQLFTSVDLTDEVLKRMETVEKEVGQFYEILDNKTCPEVESGRQCNSPHKCPYYDFCNKPRDNYTIYELPKARDLIPKLENMNIQYIKDIPDDLSLSYRQKQTVHSNKIGKPVINKKNIKEHLDKLAFPLYFFDFETINPAIPLLDNSKPYEFIPFQFSLHIQKEKGGNCVHHEFLPEDIEDPRENIIKKMLELLGTQGSIIAYSITFEKNCIKVMAKNYPKYSTKLLELLPRFWDLIVPFRNGDYAHLDFHGSASLKNVLPALVPSLSYEKLGISKGATAGLMYELRLEGKIKGDEWEKTYKDLLEYCKMDTLGMVEILKKLYKAV